MNAAGATLAPVDVKRLILLLQRIQIAVDRADRIKRGIFDGPISASEAVSYLRHNRHLVGMRQSALQPQNTASQKGTSDDTIH